MLQLESFPDMPYIVTVFDRITHMPIEERQDGKLERLHNFIANHLRRGCKVQIIDPDDMVLHGYNTEMYFTDNEGFCYLKKG